MGENQNRIKSKIIEIDKYREQLESILPSSFKEYKNNFQIKLMGERSFEKIIGSILDLSFIIIKEKQLKQPDEEVQVFDILTYSEIISEELSIKLKHAKGMRNIIAHEYGKIDDETKGYKQANCLVPVA